MGMLDFMVLIMVMNGSMLWGSVYMLIGCATKRLIPHLHGKYTRCVWICGCCKHIHTSGLSVFMDLELYEKDGVVLVTVGKPVFHVSNANVFVK